MPAMDVNRVYTGGVFAGRPVSDRHHRQESTLAKPRVACGTSTVVCCCEGFGRDWH